MEYHWANIYLCPGKMLTLGRGNIFLTAAQSNLSRFVLNRSLLPRILHCHKRQDLALITPSRQIAAKPDLLALQFRYRLPSVTGYLTAAAAGSLALIRLLK